MIQRQTATLLLVRQSKLHVRSNLKEKLILMYQLTYQAIRTRSIPVNKKPLRAMTVLQRLIVVSKTWRANSCYKERT